MRLVLLGAILRVRVITQAGDGFITDSLAGAVLRLPRATDTMVTFIAAVVLARRRANRTIRDSDNGRRRTRIVLLHR
ncbi:MAG TPA: hypothetical protein VLG74_02880 [Blastocatellia bacterium]|nr:hypothetical protein [Blastocatellia bacterium]